MEQFEHLGEWWLPDNPGRRLYGTLSFSQADGLNLSLIGHFGPEPSREYVEEQYPVVLGNAADVGLVTLVGCWLRRSRIVPTPDSTRLATLEYGVSTGFLGAHLNTKATRRFPAIEVQYSHLSDWIRPSGFSHGFQVPQGDERQESVTYSTSDPIATRLKSPDGSAPTKVNIRASNLLSIERGKTVLREGHTARFEATEVRSMDEWFHHVVVPFRDFLTFATNVPNAITCLTVFLPLERDGQRERSVDVVTSGEESSEINQRFSRYRMLLSYDDVASRLEEVLELWQALSKSIDSVLNLYMQTQYQRGTIPFAEPEFLTLVQALESYHRRKRPSNVESKEAFRSRKKRIVAAVQEDDRAWLREKLERANDKRLSLRLSELIDETDLVGRYLLADKENFIRGVTNTRNYYTHFDSGTATKRLSFPELVDAARILLLMLQVILLRELGFTVDETHERAGSRRVRDSLGGIRFVREE